MTERLGGCFCIWKCWISHTYFSHYSRRLPTLCIWCRSPLGHPALSPSSTPYSCRSLWSLHFHRACPRFCETVLPQISPCWPLVWKPSFRMSVHVQTCALRFSFASCCSLLLVSSYCSQTCPCGLVSLLPMLRRFLWLLNEAHLYTQLDLPFCLCLRSGACMCYKELVSSLCWTGLGQTSFLGAVPH